MTRQGTRIALSTIVFLHAFAFSILGEEIIEAYEFIGGYVSVIKDDAKHPIIKVKNNFIYYEDIESTSKTKSSAVCSIAFVPSLSSAYIEIEDLQSPFTSRAQQLRESQAIQDSMDPVNGIGAIVNDMVNERSYDNEAIGDTVHISATITPNRDLKDVYCAAVIHYTHVPQNHNKAQVNGAHVRVHYIGNLRKEIPSSIRVRKTLTPFYIDGVKCKLFLFSKNGKPIATNQSPKLRAVEIDKALFPKAK